MSGLDEKGLERCKYCVGSTNMDTCEDCRGEFAAAIPADVGELVERLRGYRPANEWGDPVQHTICDEAASALARVAKERDEARATLDEVCLSNRQEWQRATSAEAKLAEARKVIEPFANCAIDKADFPLGEDYEAARRFLEKTQPGATP